MVNLLPKNQLVTILYHMTGEAADIERFIRIVHDLKNPLSAILGLSDIFSKLHSENLTDKQKDMVRMINNNSRFSLSLLEDILDVERLRTGNLSLRIDDCNIKDALTEAVERNSVVADKKSLSINLKIHKNATLKIDGRRLQQLLDNLISNAVKFSHEKSKINIFTEEDDAYYIINVQDFGVGMKKGETETIFDAFAQASSRSTANEKGTGLGLCIVKELMDLHEGEVFVESEVGKGTKFSLLFPRR
jgi:signal transduction histidine kinase